MSLIESDPPLFHRSTATADIRRLSSGVVLFEPKPGCRIGRDEALENNRTIAAAGGDGLILLVARIGGIVHMDREARYASKEFADQHYDAVAPVVNNPVSRMLASFFLGINKPTTPTRAFPDDMSAVAWLHGSRA